MGKSVHLNRPGGKRIPSFGLPPTAVTKKVKSAHFQFFLNSFPRMSIKWSSSAIFSVSILSPCVCSPTPWSTGQTAPWKPFFSSTRATSAPWGPWSGQSLPRGGPDRVSLFLVIPILMETIESFPKAQQAASAAPGEVTGATQRIDWKMFERIRFIRSFCSWPAERQTLFISVAQSFQLLLLIVLTFVSLAR